MREKSSKDQEIAAPIRVLAAGIAHVALRVETESNLRQALRDFDPTVILSDFTLPQFDGLSALEIVQQCAPEVPFLVFTDMSMPWWR